MRQSPNKYHLLPSPLPARFLLSGRPATKIFSSHQRAALSTPEFSVWPLGEGSEIFWGSWVPRMPACIPDGSMVFYHFSYSSWLLPMCVVVIVVVFKDFFNVDHLQSLYWICYNIASVSCFVFFTWEVYEILAPYRDQTCTACIEKWNLDCQESPSLYAFICSDGFCLFLSLHFLVPCISLFLSAYLRPWLLHIPALCFLLPLPQLPLQAAGPSRDPVSAALGLLYVQFSSVTQSCRTLCDPMGCSMLGFPVHHQLPEVAQTHVHWVGDAI